jgi:hypothetical protein
MKTPARSSKDLCRTARFISAGANQFLALPPVTAAAGEHPRRADPALFTGVRRRKPAKEKPRKTGGDQGSTLGMPSANRSMANSERNV